MPTQTAQPMTIEAIRSVTLFASLHDQAAEELVALLQSRSVPAGTLLFRAGETGDAMYLIQSGRVRIAVNDDEGQQIVLAELAQGDFFGEMALIDGKQRSADAEVVEDAQLSVLSRENFLRFINTHPGVALEMLSAVFQRLRHTDRMLQQRVSRNVNEEAEKRATIGDRAADLIAEFGGSWKFILLTIAFMSAWMLVNILLGGSSIDPYPFVFLLFLLTLLQSFQAPIIMMSQNRQGSKDRLRADLDYQVNLKNELALAEVLRRLDVLESERLPLLFAEQNERLVERSSQSTSAS